ncbi:putative serine threonine- kinase irlB [Labeo rohita]|uniref:Putative serine threonine-kinase irlB n=1 Tax=Labeo rohita TaxID=84645 RepID=A0A498MLH7_LABRO|nr:putative serine threonine- kinase irlB [Labeo rohita]
MNKKLQKLNLSLKHLLGAVGSLHEETAAPSKSRKKKKKKKIQQEIAKGSDGTEVFLGLRDDGTEVAAKRMIKSNYQVLRNEEEFLRLPQLESPSIVKYVDFAEDDNFGYLVLQLYINGKARLADFGISRRLNLSQTTLRTSIVGTRFWKAKETIDEEVYFAVIGRDAEQYRQSAIKWLKDTKSTDRYIEGVIKRFPIIPQKQWPVALNCLNAALRISKNNSPQQEVGSQETEQQDKEVTAGTSIEESISSVQPLTLENPNISRRWHQTSHRWRPKLEKLANIDASRTHRLPGLTLVIDSEFLIANGSDGTQVFLGLRDDGTEVAVKRMIRFNYQVLRNEEEFLRLPELDSPSIVRYVDFAEDANFGYLVLQLCEYTLEEYIQDHLPDDTAERTLVLKKLVKEVLCSLEVLHSQQSRVVHRDIKPQNVLIGKARLADFGISRRFKQTETTLQTRIAGTRCWKAKETIKEKVNTNYKRSSDIQVAGMLVYYILSGGHHPFGEDVDCEYNISRGRYSLEHLDDDVAKDLVEWMINENPNERPTVEQTLAHPFFWTDDRRVRYLKILGSEKEAENCRNADEELLNAISKHTEGKSFSEWKNKLPSELVQKLDGTKKVYPENTLGLLRFIRNLHEHYKADAVKINLMALFPDLFGSVYIFAKERGWNSRESVIMDINSAS